MHPVLQRFIDKSPCFCICNKCEYLLLFLISSIFFKKIISFVRCQIYNKIRFTRVELNNLFRAIDFILTTKVSIPFQGNSFSILLGQNNIATRSCKHEARVKSGRSSQEAALEQKSLRVQTVKIGESSRLVRISQF